MDLIDTGMSRGGFAIFPNRSIPIPGFLDHGRCRIVGASFRLCGLLLRYLCFAIHD